MLARVNVLSADTVKKLLLSRDVQYNRHWHQPNEFYFNIIVHYVFNYLCVAESFSPTRQQITITKFRDYLGGRWFIKM
jgi:hypothetical protein